MILSAIDTGDLATLLIVLAVTAVAGALYCALARRDTLGTILCLVVAVVAILAAD
jgi:hypothetical protein